MRRKGRIVTRARTTLRKPNRGPRRLPEAMEGSGTTQAAPNGTDSQQNPHENGDSRR